MPYLSLIEQAWEKASGAERKRLALLLAAMVDKARPLAPPVILIPGEQWPTQEQIRQAVSTGAPCIRVEFVKAEDGPTIGTSAVKGA
jgi:hypothetical protein